MKILALTRYSRMGASSRLCVYQYLPALQKLGFEVTISPLLDDDYLHRFYAGKTIAWHKVMVDYLKQMKSLLQVKSFDLLWIEKELFPFLPAWFEQALNVAGIRYVVEYDDAIFHNYDLNNNLFVRKFLRDKIDKVMRNASLVIAGNGYLANRAIVAGAKRVEILPTVVDIDRYSVERHPNDNDKFIVGWIGSLVTVKYLDSIAPLLKTLAVEIPIKLRVIGAQFSYPGLDVDCEEWKEENEVEKIQLFDVGIMPLTDSPWERGKCGYKLIQYMACGIPVVASSVGVNCEIVKHGINGYLVYTDDEWIFAFRKLYENYELRREFGAQGRRDVEQKYCLQVTAPRLAHLFSEVILRGKA